ncbi:MAG: prolyl oligopeptidase family serine peptidase [Verrucomicrobiota bacterium]
MKHALQTLFVLLLSIPALPGAQPVAAPEVVQKWQVDGAIREGILHIPASAHSFPAPVVFAWHGHGGSMRQAANSFGYHQIWPEAICVYLQGLNTPGRLTDPEGKKPGWQHRVGDQGDRDLKLFDAVLANLKKDYKIDENRIYSAGHSNGGGFTYLLWQARGEVFAAMAPSAAFMGMRETTSLLPKPVLHVAGETDPLVKYEWQKALIDALKTNNQCGEGRPWSDSKLCTEYSSKTGNPVVTCIHPGAHGFLKEAPALIVKFFKEHPKATKPAVKP